MNLAELLSVERIVPEMESTDHRTAIAELVRHLDDLNALHGTDPAEVIEKLYRREEQTSTGIGSGVAIPHTFIPGLPEVVTVFGRSKEGIDFSALDNGLVHFVVLFVVPEEQYHLHLRTLAAIARLFSSSQIRKRLHRAEGRREILQILCKRPNRD